MNAFAHLETPLDEAPRFFVEPRDKLAMSELDRVKRFRVLFRKHFPGARIVAIPNGQVRSMAELNRARSEGASWGFPDIIAIGNGLHWAALEWKSGTGQIKDHQVQWLNWLHDRGHLCGVFRKPETAIAWLLERGFR